MDIVVVGSINMDLVTNVKRIPKKGETLIGSGLNNISGGKGANQAVAAAKLGANVEMIGRVGDDTFANDLLKSLTENKVGVKHVNKTINEPSGTAIIMVEESGDNAIVVISGANAKLDYRDIDSAIDTIQSAKIVVTQLEVPIETVKYTLSKAKALNKYTILNPAPAAYLEDDIIVNTDLLTPNETELEILSGIKINNDSDIILAGKKLLDRGVKNLIVTLGENGSMYINKDGHKKFPALKVDVVDTTAAGDSFTGALAVGLCEGKTIEDSIKFATQVAALTVTKFGAGQSLPYRHEIIEREA